MARMMTRPRLIAAAIALALIGAVQTSAPSASAGQRIDMKVLLIAADGTESALDGWKITLKSEGVPFDTLIATQAPAVTPSTFADGDHARYQAVILMSDDLAWRDPLLGWTSAFSSAEWDALYTFERTFGIRQISAYVYPKASLGLGIPTFSGPIDGLVAQTTPAGRATIPYLAGPVEIMGAYGYLALPIAPSMQTLVAGPLGETIVGIQSYADGRQEMVMTVSSSQWTMHHTLLGHGMLSWVTKGTYLGYYRQYLAVQADDLFLRSSRWDPVANNSNSPNTIRMTPTDVQRAVNWSIDHDFRIDMAYNAAGTIPSGGSPADPLTTSALANKQHFGWVSHTWSHPNLNSASRDTIVSEIVQNVNWAQNNNVAIDPSELVTGEHSGLANPNMPQALADAGVDHIASDNSVNPNPYWIGQARTVPRHPGNIYYNTGTEYEQLDEYNYRLFETCPWAWCLRAPATWAEYVDRESDAILTKVFANDPKPHFVHQANMAEDAVLLTVYDALLDKFSSMVNTQVEQPTLTQTEQVLTRREGWKAALDAGRITAYLENGRVNISSTAAVDAPITGTPFGTPFAGVRSGWLPLDADEEVSLRAIGTDSGNIAPVANPITATTTEDGSVGVTLTGSDENLDAITFRVTDAPDHGTLEGDAPNLTYRPAPNYAGSDTFAYVANDGITDSAPAAASITVTGTNDAPTAGAKAVGGLSAGVPFTVQLSGTDPDAADNLSFRIVSGPANGTLGPVGAPSCAASGGGTGCTANVVYSARSGYAGSDSFSYAVSDGDVESAPATVSLAVTNSPPAAQDQTVTTNEDTAVAVPLTANDPDGDVLTYVIVTQPQHGVLSGTAPSLTYTPHANHTGSDAFTFRARDNGGESNVATVTINVAPVNDRPSAAPKTLPDAHQSEPKAVVLSATDVDDTTLSFRITAQPTRGSVTLEDSPRCTTAGSGATCEIDATYTASAGAIGSDSFSYVAEDASLASTPAAVGVTIANAPPVAVPQMVEAADQSPLAITLGATDADGDLLSYRVTTAPVRGALSGDAPYLTYTPDPTFNGTETIGFKANDGVTDSSEAFITVRVVNQRVVFTSDRDGNNEIYSMAVTGGIVRRLTTSTANDRDPALSPDGKRVVFVSDRSGSDELWVMGIDGSGLQRLTNDKSSDMSPAWSPDGSQIVVSRTETVIKKGRYDRNLYAIRADGTGLTLMTSGDKYDTDPSWSSRGIVFTRADGANQEIVSYVPATRKYKTLVGGGSYDADPSWALDGKVIYHSNKSGVWDIWYTDWNAASPKRLIESPASELNPEVGPDGTIYFVTNRDGNFEIYSANALGSALQRLTTDPGGDSRPSA